MIENEKFQEIVLDFMKTQSMINTRLYSELQNHAAASGMYHDYSPESMINNLNCKADTAKEQFIKEQK